MNLIKRKRFKTSRWISRLVYCYFFRKNIMVLIMNHDESIVSEQTWNDSAALKRLRRLNVFPWVRNWVKMNFLFYSSLDLFKFSRYHQWVTSLILCKPTALQQIVHHWISRMLEPDDRIAQLYSQAEQQAEAVFKPTIPINRFFRNIFISDTLVGYSGTVTGTV